MVAVYAGQFGPEEIIDRRGNAVPRAEVAVYLAGTATLATLYTDRDRTATIANPLPVGVAGGTAGLDVEANAVFWADPGRYTWTIRVDGVARYSGPITVDYDPAEPGVSSPVISVNGQTGVVVLDVPVTNRYRFTSALLPKWTKALALVRGGSRDAKILCVGDSTTAGAGDSTDATIPAIKSYPARLMELLNLYVPAVNGLGVVQVAAIPDQRWTSGAGWLLGSLNLGFGGAGSWNATNPAGALVYADSRINADRFDVYALTNAGQGTVTITATGGTPVVQSLVGAAGVTRIAASAAGAATTNTVTITATGGVHIIAVEPWLSTGEKVVRVGNAGVGGTTTAMWADAGIVPGLGAPTAIQTYAPDLTIISLGINDGINSVSGADYLANLATVITAAQASGDVVLLTPPPPGGAGPEVALIPQYITAMATLPRPLADAYARAGTFAAWNAAGYMSDTWHPNDFGYLDWAQLLGPGLAFV